MDSLLSMEKVKTADCMALKKVIITVLEYLHGYFFPINDWRRNHEDHKSVPANKAREPRIHLSFVFEELMAPSEYEDTDWSGK